MARPRRTALLINVESFSAGQELFDADGEVRQPEFRELPYFAESTHLADLLKQGFHFEIEHHKDPSSAELGALVENVIRTHGNGDVIVVHVLTHGVPNPDYHGIHAIGTDRKLVRQSDVASWLMVCAERPRNGPHVLFLLDLCGAGEAVKFDEAIRRTSAHRTWIVAAAHAGTSAFDARFTRAVSRVLERVTGAQRPALDLSTSNEYLPLDTFARQVGTTVTDLARTEGRAAPQNVTGTSVDIAAPDVERAPFFHNPRYRAEAPPPRVVPASSGHDRQAGHFLSAASGHPVAEAGKGLFTGRARELNTLLGWTTGGPLTRVVTGRAGVGKSALLGMLVCTTHPLLATVAPELNRPAAAALPEGRMAAVTVRELDLTAIVMALGAQLTGARDARTPAALIDAIRRREECPVLVVDALEEALDPAAVLEQLLVPLSSASICRLLVAARSAESVADLAAAPTDLNAVDTGQLRADVEDYATALLRRLPPYDTNDYVTARAHLASSIAEALTCGEQSIWGEYLITRLYVQHIASRAPVRDEASARALGAAVPLNPADLLDTDLSGRPSWVRPVLSAVAWAHGDGMPSEVMPAVAAACAGDGHHRPTEEQVADVLAGSGNYLRTVPGTDGFVRYRLFHEGLADRLRERADADAVFDALMSTVDGRWDLASPYMQRHALDHARDAGRTRELLADVDFLLSASPAERLASLEVLGDEAAAQIAVVKAVLPSDGEPGLGQVRLAITALRHKAKDLAAALSTGLRPIWHVPLPHRVGGEDRSLPMVVTTGGTPYVEVYRLDDQPSLAFSYRHVSSILCVASVRRRDVTEILCGGNDHSVAVWRLRHTASPHVVLMGHRGPVRCVTTTVVDGETIAVTGSDDHTVRLWNLDTGDLIDTITSFDEPILDVAVTGRVVVAMTSTAIHTRDLLERRQRRHVLMRNTDTAALYTSRTGEVRTIDLAVQRSADSTVTHMKMSDLHSDAGAVWSLQQGVTTAIGTGHVSGRPIAAVATTDHGLWLHDLSTGEVVKRFPFPAQVRDLALVDTAEAPAAQANPIAMGPGYGGAVLAVGDLVGVLHIRHPVGEQHISVRNGPIAAVRVHPRDGGAFVSAYAPDATVTSFHPLTGNPLDVPVPEKPGTDVQDWALTARGAVAVRAAGNGTLAAGKHILSYHSERVTCVAVWRFGARTLAAVCVIDSALHVWDVERGWHLHRFWLPQPARAIRAAGTTVLVETREEAIAFEFGEGEL